MKKILFFAANLLMCVGFANAAVRDGTALSRGKTDDKPTAVQSRTATTVRRNTAARTTTLAPRSNAITNTSRATGARTGTPARTNTSARVAIPRAGTTSVTARATTTSTTQIPETRTGAEYEQCKNAYFACMDQFCGIKNEDYRRCSCNDRIYNLTSMRDALNEAGEKLTVFTENLDVVGMTAAQATAMKTASEGENALTSDTSASKALLQAIMNSIRGEDSTVGGKYANLNSINISFDTANAFGMSDSGQVIAAYNGQALYNAVYPQCRNLVTSDCNDASLQRAITAYLMAIEQDCNTVQTAIVEKQKTLKSAIREGGAMLDLARIENRQKHNSYDYAACINAVESAIQSEEVCGDGYYKCLDNGEFIDISTGQPIAGVKDFYKLSSLLVFSDGVEAANQKLSKNPNNRIFVQNFEKRTKKFAADALDKCTENADDVWAEYLDKALLDIYYAQKDKVSEIKQACFQHVSDCYMNNDAAITAALSGLSNSNTTILQPDKLALSNQMCVDYVETCNNMFDDNIIKLYVQNRQDTDTLTACRAIAKQCFDKYGGTNYENFYYPYSGLFDKGHALDWFSLYEVSGDSTNPTRVYKSECAKQLSEIDACKDIVEDAFGGFDIMNAKQKIDNTTEMYYEYAPAAVKNETIKIYSKLPSGDVTNIGNRSIRATGVATEVYNQIIDILSTQCMNLDGRFTEPQMTQHGRYDTNNMCIMNNTKDANLCATDNNNIICLYGLGTGEDMCPKDYAMNVDTASWGACLCWENGGRRSKWGKSAKCVKALPTEDIANDADCIINPTEKVYYAIEPNLQPAHSADNWCTQTVTSTKNQVCASNFKPTGNDINNSQDTNQYCLDNTEPRGLPITDLPEGI